MALPIFLDPNRNLMMLQTQWTSQLNPVLKNPITNPSILKSVPIASGTNTINHLLGQIMQGWSIVDITSPATMYRSEPFNDKTLTLTSSASTTVNILVF